MKTGRSLFLSLLMLTYLLASAGKGPTKHVQGKIVDKGTMNPLYGVSVSIPDKTNPLGTITNTDGEFRLWNIPEESQDLVVSLEGYKTTIVNISNLNDSSSEKLYIKLQVKVSNPKWLLSPFRRDKQKDKQHE